MNELLDSALAYARQGRRVHPCRPADKRPYTRWGTEATTNHAMLRAWWARWPDALIGLCTGHGLVVVDVDPRHGGERDDEACRKTFTATTPGGGWHHYYRTTVKIPNAVGLLPGVDLRGDRGYVIAPPSPGYAWLNDDAPMAPLPQPFIDAMKGCGRAKRYGPGFEPAPAGSIGEGQRHDYMVRFAGWAVAVLGLDEQHGLIEECIEEYRRACSPADAPDANIARIARSIARADAARA